MSPYIGKSQWQCHHGQWSSLDLFSVILLKLFSILLNESNADLTQLYTTKHIVVFLNLPITLNIPLLQ